jgi:hypothetical protein
MLGVVPPSRLASPAPRPTSCSPHFSSLHTDLSLT